MEDGLAIPPEQANDLSTEQLLWHPWDLSAGIEKQIVGTMRQNSKFCSLMNFRSAKGLELE
jgi:hypothetical protein